MKSLQNGKGFHAAQAAQSRRIRVVPVSFRSIAQPRPRTDPAGPLDRLGQVGVGLCAAVFTGHGRSGQGRAAMVGLHYLKCTFNESDESLVARWMENP